MKVDMPLNRETKPNLSNINDLYKIVLVQVFLSNTNNHVVIISIQ